MNKETRMIKWIILAVQFFGCFLCSVLWANGASQQELPMSWIALGCIFITGIVCGALS